LPPLQLLSPASQLLFQHSKRISYAKMLGHRLAEPTSDPKIAVKVNLDYGSETSDRVAEDRPSWA